jgi:protein involved in polysaccharide export with SLBB domain
MFSEITLDQQTMLEQLPPDQRASVLEKMQTASTLQGEVEETFENNNTLIKKPELKNLEDSELYCKECIYGFNFFLYSPSSFAPVDNVPITPDYIIGPGDKTKVSFYGNREMEVDTYVNREGKIILPILGPVNLSGMTFDDASIYLSNMAESELLGTRINLSISEIKSINVYLLGESYKPGKYTLSGFSSVTNALFVSGGVNEQGSLRNIQVKRNGKTIAYYDFYDFLLNGSTESDIYLQDGDVIFIPFIENYLTLGGAFKIPHKYEFIPGENIQDAIALAGGFNTNVFGIPRIELSSVDEVSKKRSLSLINLKEDGLKKVKKGDVLNVSSVSGIGSESIKLTGEVRNPGEYSIQPGETILEIINRAGGFTNQSYFQGAVFLRESVALSQKNAFSRSADQLENTIVDVITKDTISEITEFTLLPLSNLISRLRSEEPIGRMVVDLDLLALKTDPYLNFAVKNKDSLFIPKRPNFVSVVGEVLNGTTISYNPDLNVEEYISLSGGLNDSADKDKIFVVLPNGKSQLIKKSIFSSNKEILPGSTIVVSRDARPFDAISLTQIVTPILADLATSAAAIAAISD